MELFVMDENFKSLYNLDVFESLIWSERYNGCGNFEFYTPVSQSILQVVDTIQKKMEANLDCYVWLKESQSSMVIEDLEITTDAENGNHLIVSGRGLESLLERRIIWEQTSVNGSLQDCLEKLINDAIISPKITDRKIANFVFEKSDDEYIKSLKFRAQYTGDNLYDAILTICETYQLGFDVHLRSDNKLAFILTSGENRSYDQNKNPYVIFSTKYENIINSDYLESGKTLKNVTLVAGEDKGSARKKRIVGSGKGLSRKELYTDARDIQSDSYSQQLDEDKRILSEYQQKLTEYQQSLSEVTSEAEAATKEHNNNVAEYDQSKADYQNRISCFNQRITYYQQQKTSYRTGLNDSQKNSFDLREGYKNQIEYYDGLINDCDNKINNYNDKLQNERKLTYAKLVQYEEGIESEETKKKAYQEQKRPIEESKKTSEENLPNYETTLKDYEDKMVKYEGIVAEDQKSLSEVTSEASKELSDYNKRMAEYNQSKTNYQNRINQTQNSIKEYEQKIAEDERVLNDLYNGLLDQRGESKLSENTYTKAFTSEIEATKMFVYGQDFFKGDVVQIINEYDMESKVRVSEVVRVQDANGYSMYPTFQVVA